MSRWLSPRKSVENFESGSFNRLGINVVHPPDLWKVDLSWLSTRNGILCSKKRWAIRKFGLGHWLLTTRVQRQCHSFEHPVRWQAFSQATRACIGDQYFPCENPKACIGQGLRLNDFSYSRYQPTHRCHHDPIERRLSSSWR